MALTIKSNNRENINKEQALKEINKSRTVKLTINIPKSTQLAFKLATTRNGTNMTDAVLRFIEQYIQQ